MTGLNENYRFITSKFIKGRGNSTMSPRLFSYQNAERFNKNLSNGRGFNITHISRRELDTLPDSRFPLDGRHNWMDNHSIAGSVLSVTSAKAQFMNMLDSLQHSILKIVPDLPDSVRMEFDKAKEGLETITEMSIAPVREIDATSEISRSSRFICPQIPGRISTSILGGSTIPLKTGTNILKTFVQKRMDTMDKTNWLLKEEEENVEKINPSNTTTPKSISSGEDSALVFKKPKPFFKKKKSSHLLKIKSPQVTEKSRSRNRLMSLRRWYPIAVGKDLRFCGIDEDGAVVRTEAVKKRVNNRRIELNNGLNCDLIGNPDTTAFPKKLISLLKNGLTDRWRVLQKELLNCQTGEDITEVNESESSSAKIKYNKKCSSPTKVEKKLLPQKKDEKKPPPPNKRREKLSPAKKHERINSPSINETVATVQTRSGRIVKPPALFWLAAGSNKPNSALMLQSPKKNSYDESLVKKSKNTVHEISGAQFKRSAASPSENTKKAIIGRSPVKKFKNASPKKGLKGNKEEKSGDANIVHSSTEHRKRNVRSQKSRAEIKINKIGDANSTRTKRSRSQKKIEDEVESTVDDGEPPSKTSKKNNESTISEKRLLRSNDKKPSQPKKKKPKNQKRMANDKSEQENQNENDSEDDFESLFDEIQIPKIGNIRIKPQLTRRELKIVSMETPPVKYFNNSLKMFGGTTPLQSPEWSFTKRTESEVKQFQKRRAEAHSKKTSLKIRKSLLKEKGKTLVDNGELSAKVRSRDLKNVLDWVADKNVRSPQWSSRVLQYVIPSRKQMEQEDEDGDEDE